jgi:hypothetical protein
VSESGVEFSVDVHSDAFKLADLDDALRMLVHSNVPRFEGYYTMQARTGLFEDVDDPEVRMLARRVRYPGGRKARSAKRRLLRWFCVRGICLVFLP